MIGSRSAFGVGALFAVLAAGVAAHGTVACHTFESLDSCHANTDCARGTTCDSEGHFCADGAPVRVGVIVPLTGTLKLRGVGDEARAGVEFAQWLLNEGELRPLDRGISFVMLDDESDTPLARARAQELVDQDVLAIVGPMTSGQMLEAQKTTYPKHVLHLGPTLGASALADAQPEIGGERFLLQLSPDVANGSPLGLVFYLKQLNAANPTAPRCKRTVVFYNDDVTGRDFNDTYVDRFRANGMCVRASIPIPVEAKSSYDDEISQLDAVDADCVILGTAPAPSGKILETIELKIPKAERDGYMMLGNSATHVTGFLETTKLANAPSRAEGFLGADVDYTPIERTEYQEMLALYKQFLIARGASEADVAEVQMPARSVPMTDALMLLALALERVGTNHATPEALRDAYLEVAQFEPGDETFTPVAFYDAIRALRRGKKIDFSGASSEIEFTPSGFFTGSPSQIWRVKNGAFERVRQVTEKEASTVKTATGDGCK